MPFETITRTLAALCAAGVLSSCAAQPEPAPQAIGDASRRVASADDRPGPAARHRDPERPAPPGASNRQGRPGPSGDHAPVTAGPRAPDPGPGPAADAPAAPSCVSDPAGDPEASGSVPAYADLLGGCLRPEGRNLLLEAAAAGALPAGADHGAEASFEFELAPASGPTLYVYAELGRGGWSAYATRGDGRHPLAAPVISGDRVRVALPAGQLGAATRIRWRLEASWLRATTLTTSYAFDSAPDRSTASFRRG